MTNDTNTDWKAMWVQECNDRMEVERALRNERRQSARLRGELEGKQRSDPKRPQADDVHAYWVRRCHPNVTEPTKARMKALLATLHDGVTVEQLKRAIDGAACDAYVDPKGVRHDGLE